MAVPTISTISPAAGPPIGNHMIEVTGTNFRPQSAGPISGIVPPRPPSVAVLFDGVPAVSVLIVSDTRLLVRTPKRLLVEPSTGRPIDGPVAVDVEVQNIDDSGVLIPGETVTAAGGYAYTRVDTSGDNPSQLVTVVYALVDLFRSELHPNVNIVENTDYDDDTSDGLQITRIATLPGVTITGPRISENRFFTRQQEQILPTVGTEFAIYKAPRYVDLEFDITIVSDNEAEFLNLNNLLEMVMDENKYITIDYGGGNAVTYEFDFVSGSDPAVSKQTDQLNSNINVAKGIFVVRGVNLCGIAGVSGFGQVGAGAALTDGVTLEAVAQFGTGLPSAHGAPMRAPPERQSC